MSTVSTTLTTVPDQVTNVVTALSTDLLGITITWDAYVYNGISVDKAAIYIQEVNGTWSLETTSCDGTLSTVYSTRTCTIPMTTHRASPFNLVVLDQVYAQVQAHNTDGWSTLSATSTGVAVIHTEPQTPNTPTTSNNAARSIQVDWTALTSSANTGDSAILSYALYYAPGPSFSSWTTVRGVTTPDTTTETVVTGLTPATDYKFKVKA